MEINKNNSLNDLQQFKYELLQWCGRVADAAEAYQFIMGESEEAQTARAVQLPHNCLKDGVYFVIEGQAPIKFEGGKTVLPNDAHTEAVGLVMGEFSTILGHADVSTTLDRYVHPNKEQKSRRAEPSAPC